MPYYLLKVNSLRENWPVERDFGEIGLTEVNSFILKAAQKLAILVATVSQRDSCS